MSTYSVYNIKIDNQLSFTPGPTAGYVLAIGTDGNTYWTVGGSGNSDSYSATSVTTIVVPSVGSVVNFNTQDNLAYTPGQSVIMFTEDPEYYVVDDYIDDNYGHIIGKVNYYDAITGSMSIVTDYTQSIGNTYSYWHINLTGDYLNIVAGATGGNGSSGTSGSSGSSGSSGQSGSSGSSGINGSTGQAGSSGTSGNNGGYLKITQLLDNISASTTHTGSTIVTTWTTSYTSVVGSTLLFNLSFSAFSTTTGLKKFDLLVDGLVVASSNYNFNNNNLHLTIPCTFNAENLSAGNHTIQIRIPSGVIVDNLDYANLSVIETMYNGINGTSGSSGTSGTSGTTPVGPQNYAQVLGSRVTGVTTTGTTIVSGSITTQGGPISISVTGDVNPVGGTGWVRLQIHRNGTPVGNIIHAENGNNLNIPYCLAFIDNQPAGTYTYSMRNVDTMSGTIDFGEVNGPTLAMIELTGSGSSGSSGTRGTSGSSGTSGLSGSAGTSGSSGSSGTRGTSGSSGTSGASGSSGSSGSNGTSGSSGTSGTTPIGSVITTGSAYQTSASISVPSFTPVDILSFTIPVAGTFEITYFLRGQSTSAAFAAEVALYDNSNNILTNSEILAYYNTSVSSQSSTGTGKYIVTTTGPTTYKLKAWASTGSYNSFSDSNGRTGVVWNSLSGHGTSGSSGSSGTSGNSGTSGITPTTDWTLSGNLTVSGTASFNGLTLLQEVTEVINTTPGATASTVVYNFSTGANWYHSSANTNYTANFTNVPTDSNRVITVTIIIEQGATAYVPTAVQINGSSTTIRWSGSSTGNANQTDIIGFTFMRISSSWIVLGQINTFD